MKIYNNTAIFIKTFSLIFAISIFPVMAKNVNLRIHHFLSVKAPLHSKFLVPFVERLEKASNGKIKVEIFNSMSLGGRPSDLYNQAVDRAVDIVLTLPGYTSGHFNQTEVFELPFQMENAVATSKAFWDFIESDLQRGEYDEVKILSGWVHGPGVIHSKKPIANIKDIVGKEIRGPTRVITDYLKELGASPVGMPLPKIPENLSKGVIRGTLLPWEVAPSIRLAELVKNHTEFDGKKALYTATFILAMNLESYHSMPIYLRKILDNETGKKMAENAAIVLLKADEFGRSQAVSIAGNNFITIGKNEAQRWVNASKPVYDRWIKRASSKGFDGQKALNKARALIQANQ